MNNNYLSNVINSAKKNAAIYGTIGLMGLTAACSSRHSRTTIEYEDLIGNSYVEASKMVYKDSRYPSHYNIRETREDETVINYNDDEANGSMDNCNIKTPEGNYIYLSKGTLAFREAEKRYRELRDTIPKIKGAMAESKDSVLVKKYFR